MWTENEIKGVVGVEIKMKIGNSSKFFIGGKFIKKRGWVVKLEFISLKLFKIQLTKLSV